MSFIAGFPRCHSWLRRLRGAASAAVPRFGSACVEPLEPRQLLSTSATPLTPAHIVIVMEEDRFANAIGDTANMPYVNQLAAGSLVFSHLQGLNTRYQEGEMNYLGLFSGSTQGITDDGIDYSFTGPNLAEQFNSTPGLSYAGYTEGLPNNGWEVDVWPGTHYGYKIPDLYSRDFNPTAMFTNLGPAGQDNAAVNQTFSQFQATTSMPGTFANLPTVSLVVPDNLSNTHGSLDTTPLDVDPAYYNTFRQLADKWLQQNIDPYAQWAKTHNSLLIVMGDEGDRAHVFANGTQAIITGDPKLFVPGTDTTPVNAYNVLRTVEDMYGQAPLGNSATVSHLNTNSAGQLAPDTLAPTTPGTPTLSLATSTTATIAWTPSTDNVGVAGYNIYRNGQLAGTVDGSTTSFADTGLTVNTSYSYTVVAADAAQNFSAASAALNVTTPDTTPPTVPGTPTLISASESSATIAWHASTASAGVIAYKIYGNGTFAGTVNGKTTTFTNRGLKAWTSYSYTVVAVDANRKQSAASAALVIKTPDLTPPTTPTGLQLASRTSTAVTIKWKASTDNVNVSGYNIYRNGVYVTWVGQGVTAFSDSKLFPSTTYTYQVLAWDETYRRSARSAPLTVKTTASALGRGTKVTGAYFQVTHLITPITISGNPLIDREPNRFQFSVPIS